MKIYPEDNRFIKEVIEQHQYGFLYHYPVVIDVGANIGTFSIWIYENADKIYAIEPMETNVEFIRQNIEENKLDKISVYQMAISNTDVTKMMSGSDVPDEGSYRISESGDYPVRCQTIAQFMHDQTIEYADLVKLDVEGHEFEILSDPLFPHHKIGTIIGEIHGDYQDRIKALLVHMGYRFLTPVPGHFIAKK